MQATTQHETTYSIINSDCIHGMRTMPDESVNTCITSPPYWGLRDYGVDGQIGLESTPDEYVARMVEVFREVRRVLRNDGTLWLNLGDSYAGSGKGPSGNIGKDTDAGEARHLEHKHSAIVPNGLKPKYLVGIPWRVAFALQADGWYLRQDIIWHKPNPMPESVTDRCTKAHEYVFLLSKSDRYFYDADAIKEPSAYFGKDTRSGMGNIRYEGKRTQGDAAANGQQSFVTINETRNKRSVWTVATNPYKGAHFATYPPELIEPCVLAGCPIGGTVFDPFTGSGTTAEVAMKYGRNFVGTEINPEYIALAEKRLSSVYPMFTKSV